MAHEALIQALQEKARSHAREQLKLWRTAAVVPPALLFQVGGEVEVIAAVVAAPGLDYAVIEGMLLQAAEELGGYAGEGHALLVLNRTPSGAVAQLVVLKPTVQLYSAPLDGVEVGTWSSE